MDEARLIIPDIDLLIERIRCITKGDEPGIQRDLEVTDLVKSLRSYAALLEDLARCDEEFDGAALGAVADQIWSDDHDDFEAVKMTLDELQRWGVTAWKVVKHKPSSTFWMLTATLGTGDEGGSDVEPELTRVRPVITLGVDFVQR